MKFIISSGEFSRHLQAIGKVINSKNTLPTLDNFIFNLEGSELLIKASDLETTMITRIQVLEAEGEGSVAFEAKRILEILKEFPEQPLTFQINEENLQLDIHSENGVYTIVGQSSEDFPKEPELDEDGISINLNADILLQGINKTIFATADDELRPVMNGIFIDIHEDKILFVASDSHKLVRYTRTDFSGDMDASFILPKKPGGLLKNILGKAEGAIKIEFDSKKAFFHLSEYQVACRLTEGKYPSYNSVIPTDNPNKMIIDRLAFATALKRVSVFSNQASNLVKLKFSNDKVEVSAQDIDYSISAIETLGCQYDAMEMEIGFKSIFLIEILQNLSTPDIVLEMSDPARAGILLPVENELEDEDVLMLIMPMMLNN